MSSGGRLAVEFENLDNAEPASPTVVEASDELHAGMAFMTNNFLAAVVDSDPTNNVGAACSGGFGSMATACAS